MLEKSMLALVGVKSNVVRWSLSFSWIRLPLRRVVERTGWPVGGATAGGSGGGGSVALVFIRLWSVHDGGWVVVWRREWVVGGRLNGTDWRFHLAWTRRDW